MTNDSSTGGYILPTAPQLPVAAPIDDAALDTLLQNVVVGITGIAGNLIFPRWQVSPPNLPAINVNWAAIGVEDSDTPGFFYEAHNPVYPPAVFPPGPSPEPSVPTNGYDVTIEQEVMSVMCSFYGPNARTNIKIFRSGLQVAQNREAMQLAGIGLVDYSKITVIPSIINTQWYYRADMSFRIRREIVRNYPILNLVSSQATVTSDQGASSYSTNP